MESSYPRNTGRCGVFHVPKNVGMSSKTGLAYLEKEHIVKGDIVIFDKEAGYK